MEAKDTVMSEEEIKQAVASTDDKEGMSLAARFYLGTLSVAKAQAEISFPLGKQVGFEIGIEQGEANGRREVVEFTTREFGVDWSEEEEQLKKWGIK